MHNLSDIIPEKITDDEYNRLNEYVDKLDLSHIDEEDKTDYILFKIEESGLFDNFF